MANKPLKSIKFPGLDDTYIVPQVDDTLSMAGGAADAKKTGDEVASLKSAMDDNGLAQLITDGWIDGKRWYTPEPGTAGGEGVLAAARYVKISCNAGDKFIINGTAWAAYRPWAFFDANDVCLTRASGAGPYVDKIIEAPTGTAYLGINQDKSIGGRCYSGNYIGNTVQDLASLIASKQDALSFDSAPTSASANPVTSDGILNNSINARGTIPSESDIDNYKEIGVYAVSTQNIAMTLTHWPLTSSMSGKAAKGILIVFAHRASGSGASFGIGQIAISVDRMFVRSYEDSTWKSWMEVYNSSRIDSEPKQNSSNAVTSGGVYSALRRQNPVWANFTKFYSHLFIDGINQGVTPIIPSETVFEVSVAKRLGFDLIEGHLQRTADNKYVVMHGSSGKIGYALVKTVDGSYDPDTAISSLTLEQIRTNYRYKSQNAKYQVPVTSAEEWLLACRNAGMIPVINADDDDAITLVEQYCKDYIRYGGQRTDNTVMLMQYQNKLGDTLTEAKNSIDALVTTYGLPLYICTFSIDQYTDDELTEIVHYAHEKGAFIGACNCYYDYGLNRAIRVQKAGFDFAPSAWEVNDFSVGNILNLSSDFDFDDFVTTGSESGGVLILAQGDTITIPAQSSIQLGKGVLKVLYDGKITVAMGHYWTYGTEERRTYSSDGRNELSFSTYYLNEAPTFTVTATEATTVRAISYRSAEC